MEVSGSAAASRRALWWTMGALYFGALMVSLDATVVNIAIPSMARDLQIPDAYLTWLANAYLSTYGGLMLLTGRLGDVLGHRRIFLIGIFLFTVASFGCGMATGPWGLIVGRAVQGVGGAITSTASLALVRNVFSDSPSRARAMGIFSLVAALGSVLGVVVGGVVTGLWGWHWVFFVNIPVGIAVSIFCLTLIPSDRPGESYGRLDVGGALTITASLILANYALTTVTQAGWTEPDAVGALIAAGFLILAFFYIEQRVEFPIFPLDTFKSRNLVVVSVCGALLSAALITWTFVSSFYLQFLHHLTPIQAGSAYLPLTASDALVSIAIVPVLIKRVGLKSLVVWGALLMSVGIFTYAISATRNASFLSILSGMGALGFGIGLAYGPLLLSVLDSAPETDSGMISGVVSTSWTLGGTLGFAGLVSAVTRHSSELFRPTIDALNVHDSEYQTFFCVSALIAAATAVIGGLFIRTSADELQRSPS